MKGKGEMKRPYKTKQLAALTAFLEEHRGEHFSAADVLRRFAEERIPVSAATVYRRLERMAEDGMVEKTVSDGSEGACFLYRGGEADACEEACYHCRCERCGKLIHLRCSEFESVCRHIREEHGFSFDIKRLTLYGVCSECAEKNGESAGR